MKFNEIKKYLVGFVVGLISVYLFFEEEGVLRFFALAGFLTSTITFFVLIINYNLFVEYASPIMKKRYSKNEKKAFVIECCIILIFAVLLYIHLYKSDEIPNTLNGKHLAGILAGIYLILLLPLIYSISKIKSPLFQLEHFRFISIMGTSFTLFIVILKLGFFINYIKSEIPSKKIEVTILEKKHFLPSDRHLIVKINEANETLEVPLILWNDLQIGDVLEMQLHKGFFGYEVVDKIKKK